MSKQDQIQDCTETEPLGDLSLTAEQAEGAKAGPRIWEYTPCCDPRPRA